MKFSGRFRHIYKVKFPCNNIVTMSQVLCGVAVCPILWVRWAQHDVLERDYDALLHMQYQSTPRLVGRL